MKKIRLIQSMFTNLTLSGKLSPQEVKKRASRLKLLGSNSISEALGTSAKIGEFRKQQVIGKIIIDGNNTYRIIDYIGVKVKNYFGKFYQYALIKI